MRFQGGKARQAKAFSDAMLKASQCRGRYIEPFVGGASVAAYMAPHFKEVLLSDISLDLILLYEAMQSGWTPPLTLSKDRYNQLRSESSSAERGWAGYAGSYCGKWFGGYGPTCGERDYLLESYKSMTKKMGALGKAKFECKKYSDLEVQVGDIVYCDPPYVDTTAYKDTEFDIAEFWDIAESWVRDGAIVFVSEFVAPSNWRSIYTKSRFTVLANKSSSKKDEEHLFTLQGSP